MEIDMCSRVWNLRASVQYKESAISMKLGSSGHLKSVFRRLSTMTVLCGAIFVCWPAPNALAQCPAGPLPAHEQTDVDTPPRTQSSGANSASQADNGPAKIAGVWKLNKDQSDDPRKAMQAAAGGDQGGGGGRGGWGGGGGMGGGRGRGGNGGRSGAGNGMMADYDQLTIGHMQFLRRPAPSDTPPPDNSGPQSILPELPLKVIIKQFAVQELSLGEPVVG